MYIRLTPKQLNILKKILPSCNLRASQIQIFQEIQKALENPIDEEDEEEVDEEAQKRTGIQLAISVGQILIENAEGELLDWLADMANMEREEFEESAIDTPLIVIENVIEQEGFQNFLSRASSLYKKMNSSAGQYLDS